MRRTTAALLAAIALLAWSPALSQQAEFIPLWDDGSVPGMTEGAPDSDQVRNERIYAVATPGIWSFPVPKEHSRNAAVLVIPSGGYNHLTVQTGGFQLARWYNTLGFDAYVLIYRLPCQSGLETGYRAPIQDAQRAMRIIRSRHGEKGYMVGVMGCSAGGHLAAVLATMDQDMDTPDSRYDGIGFMADFALLVSPVITMTGPYTHPSSRASLLAGNDTPQTREMLSMENQVTSSTCPCLLIHAMDDTGVSCMNSVMFFSALLKAGVRGCHMSIFPTGGHGISLRGNMGMTDSWTSLAVQWLDMTVTDDRD